MRIRVAVAGVHLVDTAIRAGRVPATLPRPDLPVIPGREVGGAEDMVADRVEEQGIGRRVVAC